MKNKRNYQLDFLKLVFTGCVFLSHTHALINENTNFYIPTGLGWISVHFFFVLSGMLMVDSFMRKNNVQNNDESGKAALSYVLNKFQRLAMPYWVALILRTLIQIVLYAKSSKTINQIIFRMFPEIFAINGGGILPQINNPPDWYISAMLIVMLPLYYLMAKKTDFFIYVFAPLGAILTFGWMFSKNPHLNQLEFQTYFNGAVIRAFAGICFGVIAWLIFDKLRKGIINKYQHILITLIEIISWIIFFGIILQKEQWYVLEYSVMLLLPITIAITFSGKSYLAKLFHLKIFQWVAPLSLAIYLNHSGAVQITIEYFKDLGYKRGVFITVVLTMIICLLYFGIIKFFKVLWNRKLKKYFTNGE